MVYWPTWVIFAEIGGMVQRIEVDGVAGSPLNIEEVPEKEKTWLEVTADTLERMKSPSGWAHLAGSVTSMAGSKVKGGLAGATQQAKPGGQMHHTVNWLFTTKMGVYTLILLLLLILVMLFSGSLKPYLNFLT
jgi:hypothetical protein